jgi:uncharacterized protein
MVHAVAAAPAAVRAAVRAAVEVARGAPGAVAAALVGSWARGTAGPGSDVDLVVLTGSPERWLDDDRWVAALGAGARLVAQRDFGAVQERRVLLRSGLEVELGVARPSWAGLRPVDAGTRRVVGDGLRVLWDSAGLLDALVRTVASDP